MPDTEPAPPPDLEMRVIDLERRADATDQAFDELERFLEAKIELLRDDITEWFRRKREGVTNGGG